MCQTTAKKSSSSKKSSTTKKNAKAKSASKASTTHACKAKAGKPVRRPAKRPRTRLTT